MANNCMTFAWVEGPKEQIDKLEAILCKLEKAQSSKEYHTDIWGSLWLGNIVKELNGDPDSIYCRGYFFDPRRDCETQISFNCESAWAEPHEVFKFLEETLLGIKVYFYAEEPGSAYFVTNDEEYEDGYVLCWDGIWDSFRDQSLLAESVNDWFAHTPQFSHYEIETFEELEKLIESDKELAEICDAYKIERI